MKGFQFELNGTTIKAARSGETAHIEIHVGDSSIGCSLLVDDFVRLAHAVRDQEDEVSRFKDILGDIGE